ncbi:putative TetR-family transcriptional regulator [Catellatospora methionotrophica]|uniref:Putative TetR-family transcriptional regulator n=1 Tax=Catellatospora methionotrophica TaxID=121620 RepID=A0A8J3LTY3_9ACTN|nr:TetR/AcrR family transcriptional regulator [Catellatospora methionotrophica]GIG18735.1 putative TetR-family transcriptional regulator [Catellatospora methionotrophica]
MRTIGYHHGDLRRTVLDAAVDAIGASGLDGWSLRELARRAGVSHAAPAHHFGDKAGLLTALAAEGFDLLAETLRQAGTDFLEAGLAYVRFATEHPVHFGVMFQPKLYRADDDAVRQARDRAGALLAQGARAASPAGGEDTARAGWSIAHGFASLWLAGALTVEPGTDPVDAARPVLRRLLER